MKKAAYNFDIKEMISIFDFDNFIKRGKKRISNSAILLITNKQYIISYTANKGKGYHSFAFTRLLKELMGGGSINSSKEAIEIKKMLEKYIHARILFEDNNGAIIFSGLNNLNKYNYNIFLQFYDDYNEVIKNICNKNKFIVGFYNEADKQFITSKDLDKLLFEIEKDPLKESSIEYSPNETIMGINFIKEKKR